MIAKLLAKQRQIEKLAESWVGEKRIYAIVRGLNKLLSKDRVVFVSSRFDEKYLPDYPVLVSGLYQEKFCGMPDIIYIYLSIPSDKKTVTITEKGAKFLALSISRTLFHESRHRYQVRKRKRIQRTMQFTENDTKDWQRKYLSWSDEIDAYAYETKADTIPLYRLRVAHKITWKDSDAIHLYRKHFRKHDAKIWRKFLKKVYKNTVS